SAINAAPTLLNRFLQDLVIQTGWWFTVIGGGPDPADNGNICTGRCVGTWCSSFVQPDILSSFHIGRNEHGHHFENEYTHFSVNPKDTDARHTSFDESVIAPFGRYLKTLFREFSSVSRRDNAHTCFCSCRCSSSARM
ncbi:hypothetical protein EDD18DRAFT_1080379, partial [Armillaria luteobubalina]